MVINILLTIIQQGLCYALVAMGVYITYKILDFPDLTVDGSFPLGAAVAVRLIVGGMHFIPATIIAMFAGSIAGLTTGILHVKFKISNLLAGILTMTGLLSINLAIAGKRTLIPYRQEPTMFSNHFTDFFGSNGVVANIVIFVIIVVVIKIILDLFLKTKMGLMLRAVGNNEQMCTSLGRDGGNYKILGLVVANSLVALAGAIYSQYQGYFDNNSGVGMVVLALASVIIGCAMFRKVPVIKGTTAVIIGAIIYTACLNIIIALGVPSFYLKLFMAVLFAIILVLNNTLLKNGIQRKSKNNNQINKGGV
ncbi:MAG: ABC transporter permease [Clostridia bacterium]